MPNKDVLLTAGWIGIAGDLGPDGVIATEGDQAISRGIYQTGASAVVQPQGRKTAPPARNKLLSFVRNFIVIGLGIYVFVLIENDFTGHVDTPVVANPVGDIPEQSDANPLPQSVQEPVSPSQKEKKVAKKHHHKKAKVTDEANTDATHDSNSAESSEGGDETSSSK